MCSALGRAQGFSQSRVSSCPTRLIQPPIHHPSTRIARQDAGATTDDRPIHLPQGTVIAAGLLVLRICFSPIYPGPGQAAASPHASLLRPYRTAVHSACTCICADRMTARESCSCAHPSAHFSCHSPSPRLSEILATLHASNKPSELPLR